MWHIRSTAGPGDADTGLYAPAILHARIPQDVAYVLWALATIGKKADHANEESGFLTRAGLS